MLTHLKGHSFFSRVLEMTFDRIPLGELYGKPAGTKRELKNSCTDRCTPQDTDGIFVPT